MKSRIILSISVFVLFLSCEKIEIDAIHNLNNGKVFLIGHAGEGFSSQINHYPFNSKGSISRALKFHRVDGIEVDFQMSKDHKGILYHDNYLDTKTTCAGPTYYLSQAELKNCRYSSGIYSSILMSEYLIDLKTAFVLCMEQPDPKPFVFIDIKSNPTGLPLNQEIFNDSLTSLLSNLIRQYIPDKIHYISSDAALLNLLKSKAPYAHYHIESGNATRLIDKAISNGFDGIVATEDDMEEEDSKRAHDNGLYVSIFGVRSMDDIDDALELNPDFIHTDNIPLTQNVLRSL